MEHDLQELEELWEATEERIRTALRHLDDAKEGLESIQEQLGGNEDAQATTKKTIQDVDKAILELEMATW